MIDDYKVPNPVQGTMSKKHRLNEGVERSNRGNEPAIIPGSILLLPAHANDLDYQYKKSDFKKIQPKPTEPQIQDTELDRKLSILSGDFGETDFFATSESIKKFVNMNLRIPTTKKNRVEKRQESGQLFKNFLDLPETKRMKRKLDNSYRQIFILNIFHN